jgi:hypothetical protein
MRACITVAVGVYFRDQDFCRFFIELREALENLRPVNAAVLVNIELFEQGGGLQLQFDSIVASCFKGIKERCFLPKCVHALHLLNVLATVEARLDPLDNLHDSSFPHAFDLLGAGASLDLDAHVDGGKLGERCP